MVNFTCLVIPVKMFLIYGDVESFDFTNGAEQHSLHSPSCFICENNNVLQVDRRSVYIHHL